MWVGLNDNNDKTLTARDHVVVETLPCRTFHFCKHVFFSRLSSHQKHMPSLSIISEGVHQSVSRTLVASFLSIIHIPQTLAGVSLRWALGHWGRVGAYIVNDDSILVYVGRVGVRRGWSVHRTKMQTDRGSRAEAVRV